MSHLRIHISKMTDIKDLGFSTADFAVFVTMLVVSFGIGIYHAVVSPNSKEGKIAHPTDIRLTFEIVLKSAGAFCF